MNPQQPFPPGDKIIMCYRGYDAKCETCAVGIAAVPASIEKAKQPGWHLICRRCLARFAGTDVLLKGRYRSEAEARKTLPED